MLQKYFQMIISYYHMYAIKMASEVCCSEDFVTDNDMQETHLYQRKKPKLSYGSILGLK